MNQTEAKREQSPPKTARDLLRRGLKGTLATLDRASGYPYASLVTVATDQDASPLLLISKLALHTQNLAADARASLLIDGTNTVGDPLAGGRATFIGKALPTHSPTARARFLARHPHSAAYADFPDFAFFTLVIERVHYIGGFGRIVDLSPADILVDTVGAEPLIAAEEDIVAHMNTDHADAVSLYATVLCGAPDGNWRISGVDPMGVDMISDADTARLDFESRITSAEQARKELVRLVNLAREVKARAG